MRRGRRIGRWVPIAAAALAVAVVVLNWTYGRLPAEPRPHGSFVDLGGLRLHYLERPGRGIPILLLHGLPGTAEDWNEVTALLPGRRTIAIDRPGFGYSSGGYVPFDRQMTTVHALLARLHVARLILVGHSYGGTLALGYTERYPRQVAGLVLVDAAAGGLKIGLPEKIQAHLLQVAQAPVIRQVVNATFGQLMLTTVAKLVDGKAFSPQPVAAAHRRRVLAINMTHGNLEAYAGEQLAATGVVAQVDRGMGEIRTATIVIQGVRDELVAPKYGRRIAAGLPGARLEPIEGGHMAPYTHPYAVAAAIEELARGAERSAQTATAAATGHSPPGSASG